MVKAIFKTFPQAIYHKSSTFAATKFRVKSIVMEVNSCYEPNISIKTFL
ncbi:hypothetical protein UABAM_04049 [Candidatus Uabimicrobium amorphum]|uniref:Uncharacterized protein n=1 Tax=Uabimicrobium amorphum TaxID=2596890 RepID=A0A5S9IS52_UABAM|nr:hypothetical protein UABAM_04049 [Candidatus Uabimicrobium amorphum]